MIIVIVYLAFIILIFASMWRICEKAGRPGWNGIVPIYNSMVLAEIAGKPSWWGLACLIPFVGIVFAILIIVNLAKAFGQGTGFAIGMIFLGFIFFPMLAFGDAKYIGGVPEQRGFAPVMPSR